MAELFQLRAAPSAPASLTLTSEAQLTRTGRALRLVQTSGTVIGDASADPTLVRLLAKARMWWGELRTGQIDVPVLARREGLTPSYITRVLRLSFLAPSVVETILAGRQRASNNAAPRTAAGAIPMRWSDQEAIFR